MHYLVMEVPTTKITQGFYSVTSKLSYHISFDAQTKGYLG